MHAIILPYLEKQPNAILVQGWVDCLLWSVTEEKILAQFRQDTGCQFTPGRSVIERMIDQATGYDEDFVRQYVAWFDANVWGEV